MVAICVKANQIITLAESVRVWNSDLGLEHELSFDGVARCLAVNDNYLAVGTQQGRIKVWFAFKELQTLELKYPIEKLHFSMLGNELGTNQEVLELGVDGLFLIN